MVLLSFLGWIVALVATCFISLGAADSSYIAVEKLQDAPDGWLKGPAAPSSKLMKFHIAVRQEKVAEFEQLVLDMSTPGSHNYGQHMKRDELRATVSPSNHTMRHVVSWLESENIPAESIKSHGNWIEVTMRVAQAESLMKTKFYRFTHRKTHKHAIRTLSYSVPRDLYPHIQLIQPTTRFGGPTTQFVRPAFEPVAATFNELTADCPSVITPDCLRELYGLYDTSAAPDPRNRLGISGYLEQYARYSDFDQFVHTYAPNRTETNFTVISINGGLNLQDSPLGSTEASLDIQYAIALAYDALATFYSTAGRGPYLPGTGKSQEDESTNEPYLEQLHYLLNLPDEELPAVLSTSYGEEEQSVPESYTEATCNLFAQLGARGVSVIFSSGDDGVGSSCLTNDGTSKARFQPIFPASCPFVTSVGGTYGSSPEKAIDFSGGGFSDRFQRHAYQDAAVESYLKTLGDKWDGLYNPRGRGIPDVAAQANNYLIVDHGNTYKIGGTSASAPVFAAIVSQLNAARLKDGKPRLGFLNPWLYTLNQTGFTDIIDGGSVGCLGDFGVKIPYASWNATPGWDPATGLGTPFYNTLVKVAREAAFPRPLRLICQALIVGALILIVCQSAYVLHAQSEFDWEKNTTPRPNGRPPKTLRPGPSDRWDESIPPPDCKTFPATSFAEDGIQVTLKIGGAEPQDRLRSHINGVTSCISNLLVVSDMGQQLGKFHSHDVLADVIHVLSKEDQREYQRQREYHYYWDKELQPTKAGWNLDRYKFLSMVEYAYAQNPSAKWYVFMETDTLMIWENVVQLLSRFNWTEPLYLGSPTPGRPLGTWRAPEKTFFAYGGSGFILSVTAMENLLREDRPGSAKGGSDQESQLLITKYQDMVREDCCGDSVLGWVAAQRDVKLMGQWPMFNPRPLHDTPLGKAHWCQPAVSFHKSDPFGSVELWNWQQKRLQQENGGDLQRPFLYSDVVDFFDFDSKPVRENWNNADLDSFDAPSREAHSSLDACKEACHDHDDCLQYTYRPKKCRLVRVIRLGVAAEPPQDSPDERSVAGWDVDKIREFKKDHGCETIDWPEPSTERIF
ncbi:peptidase S8/S53 domain-containing protein [Aspergillus karnatakaensis]|uniref:peptidase S8/S53 domain-containing protein n=1 Tax=Aspergillus karnatakaensis TaxID=1810916 RepID=UPI003CCDE849